MAKVKTYSVSVEITTVVTVFVDARRPGGAEERLKTEEGWREAVRWEEPRELPLRFDPATMKISRVREL